MKTGLFCWAAAPSSVSTPLPGSPQAVPTPKICLSYMTASISIGAVLGNFLGGQVLNAAGLHLMLLFSFLLAAAGTLIVVIGVKAGSRRGADAR